MGSMVWQLVCLLLGVMDYSITPPFMLVLALPLISTLAKAIVPSLLLLLLELPETLRHYWIRATRKLHSHPPSTSHLLSLPLELRESIWTMLLGDFDYVYIRDVAPICYTSYVELLRLYLGINPEYSAIWFSMQPTLRRLQPRIAFSQSCHHLHNEAGHFLYGHQTFSFTEAKVLVSWIRNLTPAHRRHVRDIEINMPNDFFDQSGVAESSLTRDAVHVRNAMQELSGLRKLSIRFWTRHWLRSTKHEAQGVYQLVKTVQVSETLVVRLEEERDVRSEDAVWTEVEWPAHSQEDFAYAVWARVRDPGSALQQRVQVEGGSEAKYVLKVKEYEG